MGSDLTFSRLVVVPLPKEEVNQILIIVRLMINVVCAITILIMSGIATEQDAKNRFGEACQVI